MLSLRFLGLGLIVAFFAVGCATRPSQTHKFEPLPAPRILDEKDLEKPTRRATNELLRAADEAFRAGNAAQEQGDPEAALSQYRRMLELLVQADLDPVVFYNLRYEFARVLEGTTQQTYLFEHGRRPEWDKGEYLGAGVVADLPIPFPLPAAVLEEIEEIQKVYPKGFQAGLDASSKYAPWIRQELTRAGMPRDLVWLAMVESQFKPHAKSRAGALGMWQFMSSTARRYGLRIDSHVDERLNWEISTLAALAYLQALYQQFGEWPVAISAYNMGEHGMERTVNSAGGEKDIWAILNSPAGAQYMQAETRKFYPKLVATLIVASNPERYGFVHNPQPPDVYVRVPVKGSYSLAALEKACGLSSGTLKALNPDLLRGVTPPTGEYLVAVPIEANAQFVAALNKLPQERPHVVVASDTGETGTYTVRKGDTISEIATRFRVSSKDLMQINNIRSPSQLQVGKRLLIPGRAITAGVISDGTQGEAQPGRTHRVRRGDTLYDLARQYGVTISDLEKWNNMDRRTKLRVNQVLHISPPVSAPTPPPESLATLAENAPAGKPITETVAAANPPTQGERRIHKVVAGDTASKIAHQYGVPLRDFLAWNNLTEKSVLRVGDQYVVYSPGERIAKTQSSPSPSGKSAEPTSTPETEKEVHRVAKGQSPWVLAQLHGVPLSDLMKWNGWTDRTVLRVGDQYAVHKGAKAGPSTNPPGQITVAQSGTGERIIHTVVKGENPTTIAQRYGVRVNDLFHWNGWHKGRVLQIGEQVIIFR